MTASENGVREGGEEEAAGGGGGITPTVGSGSGSVAGLWLAEIAAPMKGEG